MGAFTLLDSSIVAAVAAEYGLHVSKVRLLNGGMENTNALLATREGSFVLTVLEKKDPAMATAYATYLNALADAGLPVPQVLQHSAGGRVAIYGSKPVIISEYVAGHCYDPLPMELLFLAGATLARVHAAQNIDCPLPPYLRLRDAYIEKIASFPDADFSDWVLRQHQRVCYVVNYGGVQVPIHGDLFADNIIVRDANDIVFLDWDDGSLDYPWIDIGMAILGLCCGRNFLPERARLLLAGYQSVSADRLDFAVIRDAAIYVALFTACNRYSRRGTNRSYSQPQRSYQVIPEIVTSLQKHWGDVSAAPSGVWTFDRRGLA
jgi:homoserine kinase type II